MVHTRRMESVGLSPELPHHKNHKQEHPDEIFGPESSSASESAESQERVRELRNRFVCSKNNYSSSSARVRSRNSRSHRSRVFETANMNDDSDESTMDSDHIFAASPRRCFSSQGSRRLRPLKNLSYTTMRQELEVRRSTRQRKLQYDNFNTSWITDAQMVKGYPSLTYDFMLDNEDSRQSQESDVQPDQHKTYPRPNRHGQRAQRAHGEAISSTRPRREIKVVSRYSYDCEQQHSRRSSGRLQQRGNDHRPSSEEEPEEESQSQDVKPPSQRTRRTSGRRAPPIDRIEAAKENKMPNGDIKIELEEEDKEGSEKEDGGGEDEKEDDGQGKENGQDGSDSESEPLIRRQTRRRPTMSYRESRFPTRKTRQQKISDSDKTIDFSEDDMTGRRMRYTLRQRKPKPDPIPMREIPARANRFIPHRRRNRRRSSPSSSSSSDARERKHGKDKGKEIRSGPSSSVPMPIGPEKLDEKVRFQSVGGLDNHVRCLREMIILPMMYPEVFKLFQIQPPRGVLFHGPPGTGKTLIARALASECCFGPRKISFFMRKGADLLSKWVGESEKQLRMLFEQAAEKRPSIIFFDELDGLAPVRSSKQDQIHASIVSTLLALMDGLDARGEVIVIGATNRIDAIDPALRRPGRFDRELFFPLPARKQREEILNVHLAHWSCPPDSTLVGQLAEQSAGYCGSDLRALCSEAVIQSLRRVYPQVYTTNHRLQLDPSRVVVDRTDFLKARAMLVPASHRVTPGLGRKLPAVLQPLLDDAMHQVVSLLRDVFPHGVNTALAHVRVSGKMQKSQLLITGDSDANGQTIYLAPALLHSMEHVHSYSLDLSALHRETSRSPEEACVEVFNEARKNVPSVVYVPNVERWWPLVGETVRAIFLSQLALLDPSIPLLLLATAGVPHASLPEEIGSLFSRYRNEIIHLANPSRAQRDAYFRPLIIRAALKAPKLTKARPKTPPSLPRAPTPPPEPPSEKELQKMYDKEEETLRELRIFLRDMCWKLARNKLFYVFTKPVDLEEAPDYLTIIKEPMDLETMMTKVDHHKYSSAQEFLADVDLICRNALEYNPDRTAADKLIRHRACSLRDHAHALIKAEMDTDFEDNCRGIARRRMDRKASVTQYLPPYIHTASNAAQIAAQAETAQEPSSTSSAPAITVEKPVLETPIKAEKPEKPEKSAETPRKKRKWCFGNSSSSRPKKRNSRASTASTAAAAAAAAAPSPAVESPPKVVVKVEVEENPVEEMPMDPPPLEAMEESISGSQESATAPLNVNCDTTNDDSICVTPENSPSSKKHIVTEALSPAIFPSFADLLEDCPDLQELDPSICENEETSADEKRVVVNQEELESTLAKAVDITEGCTLMALLDLYSQLCKVVTKYERISDRSSLPQDLENELQRFQEKHLLANTVPSSSSNSISIVNSDEN